MLNATSSEHAHTIYGAIWFSHFQDSMSNGTSYSSEVSAQCVVTNQLLNYTAECSRFNGVGYTVQYNFTAIHAALHFEQVANEALVRRGTSDDTITVETIISPLPVTKVEEKIGAGIDAFLAWFLVSTYIYDIQPRLLLCSNEIVLDRSWLVSHL